MQAVYHCDSPSEVITMLDSQHRDQIHVSVLAVYHCDHLTRRQGGWSLCWLSSIVITSLGDVDLVSVLAV